MLAERLWGMVLVITFKLLSKAALLYIYGEFYSDIRSQVKEAVLDA